MRVCCVSSGATVTLYTYSCRCRRSDQEIKKDRACNLFLFNKTFKMDRCCCWFRFWVRSILQYFAKLNKILIWCMIVMQNLKFMPLCYPIYLSGILKSKTEYKTIWCLFLLVRTLHFLRFCIFKNQQNALITCITVKWITKRTSYQIPTLTCFRTKLQLSGSVLATKVLRSNRYFRHYSHTHTSIIKEWSLVPNHAEVGTCCEVCFVIYFIVM
jgi:hypothetical protein